MSFGIEEQDNTVKVSGQGNPKQFASEVENLLHREEEQVNIVASDGAIRKAVSTVNILERNLEGTEIDLNVDVEVSEEREEHQDDDKDWYYHDELLIVVSKGEEA